MFLFFLYDDRLYKLNLKFLEYCRLDFDLILTYKICYQLSVVDIKFDEYFTHVESRYNLRKHSFVLRCKHKPKHFTESSISKCYRCSIFTATFRKDAGHFASTKSILV